MKVFKDVAIYVAGQFIAKLPPFLLLPYLTRELDKDGFGELSFFLSIVAFIYIFINLSQHGSVLRYYHRYGKNGINSIIVAGQTYSAILSIIGIAVIISLDAINSSFVYCILLGFFQSLIANQLSIRQAKKDATNFLKVQVCLSFLNVGLTILFFQILNFDKVFERLAALILSNLATWLIALTFWGSFKEKTRVTKKRFLISISYVFSFGLPLILHVLSLTIKGQLDRLIIYNTFSVDDLGIYAAGVQLATILLVAISAINTALVPYLYEALKTGVITGVKIKRFFIVLLPLTIVPAIITHTLPSSFFEFVLGQGYESTKYYTSIFVFTYSLTIPYLIIVNYLYYYGRTADISLSSLISTTSYIVLILYFSTLGLDKVPFASVLSNMLMLPVLYYFFVKQERRLQLESGNKYAS